MRPEEALAAARERAAAAQRPELPAFAVEAT